MILKKRGYANGIGIWGVYIPFVLRIILIAIPVTIAIYFGGNFLSGFMNNIPVWLTNGLAAMGACLPAVGFAIITNLIAKPKYVIFFFAGFFLVQYAKIGAIPLLLAGIFITFIYITFSKNAERKSNDEDDDDEEESVALSVENSKDRVLSKGEVFRAWTRWWIWCETGHSFVRMMALSFCNVSAQ